MIGTQEDSVSADEAIKPPIIRGPMGPAFFEPTDWLSFWITTVLTLGVYLYTLAPEVTLEMSGILSTGAMYAGVAHPPGFPVWTVYAWLFTKLLPFSNVAWRVAVSSSVAGAFTCGVIALMVSRGGAMILEGVLGFKRLEPKEERTLRLVCGAVAGMVFGFNGVFWGQAVIVETKPLSILLFSIVLGLLVRWSYAPVRTQYLYAAFFLYGLTVSASPVLIPAALGLPFFVMFADQKLGRELFFAAAVLSAAVLLSSYSGYLPMLDGNAGRINPVWAIYFGMAILTAVMCVLLIVKTRSFLTRWGSAVTAGLMAVLGTTPYLWLPLASMTNPPSNWGYARTAEGFFHVITRGQYERFNPTQDLGRFLEQIWIYGGVVVSQFGMVYLVFAAVPFCVLGKMGSRERRVMLGLVAFYLCLSLFLLILLNPPPDRSAVELIELFFPPSYVLLAVWTGYGLVLVGTLLSRPRTGRPTVGGAK